MNILFSCTIRIASRRTRVRASPLSQPAQFGSNIMVKAVRAYFHRKDVKWRLQRRSRELFATEMERAFLFFINFSWLIGVQDRLCGLVVRVLGYRSGGPGSIPGTTRKKKCSGSGTGSTQPREYN
jgi:hypothetical protein